MWDKWRRVNGKDQLKDTEGFVVVTEDLYEEFSRFESSELKPHLYLPENSLVLHWFSIMNEVPVSTNKFGDAYLQILPEKLDEFYLWMCDLQMKINNGEEIVDL